VQVELVDHLATSIELQFEENPKLSFDDALKNVYQSFGATGFGKYMSEKETQTIKMLKNERKQIILKLFTPPTIFMVLMGLFVIIFPVWEKNLIAAKDIAILMCVIFPIFSILFLSKYRQDAKMRNKKLFILDNGTIFSYSSISSGGLYLALQLLVRIFSNEDGMKFGFYAYTFLIIGIYIASLYMWASWQQYKKANILSQENYPLAFQK
jgi:hypothetical protein